MSASKIIEKSVEFESGQLSYAIAGAEHPKTLCFIPGWGGNRHLMYDVAQSFADRYKVIVVEFPGFRDSQLSAPFTIDRVIEALEHILQQEKVTQTTLLGHSMGGVIALSYAAKNPQMADQVIGIDSFTYPGIYPKQPDAAVEGFISAIAPDFKAGLAPIIDMSCNQYTSDESKAQIIETFYSADPDIGLPLLKECLEWDMLDQLDSYKGPVSAIVAAPSYDEQSFRENCPSRIDIHLIENSAHFIAQDQPQRLIEEITRKLS